MTELNYLRDAINAFNGGENPHSIHVQTFPSRDAETQDLLAELSNLQTWCTLMARKDSGGMPAYDLIQRTRIYIIERAAVAR